MKATPRELRLAQAYTDEFVYGIQEGTKSANNYVENSEAAVNANHDTYRISETPELEERWTSYFFANQPDGMGAIRYGFRAGVREALLRAEAAGAKNVTTQRSENE
jgi:hypothetical protein